MRQTELPCPLCGQGMIEIDFNRTHYLYMCDNGRCLLFRERQGTREKSLAEVIGEPEKKKPAIIHADRPGYEAWLAEKRLHYRELRDIGVSPKQAAKDCSRKRARERVKKRKVKV